jgi:molybdopterin-guanine dinucleotide biosynthesis protein A
MVFKAAGIILAGGQSRRMDGSDKALLRFGDRSLIEHKVERLGGWFSEVIIVGNGRQAYDYPGVKVVHDEQEGCGPLMGLYSGLKGTDSDLNFLTACDMPFENKRLIRLLMETAGAEEADVAAPEVNGYWEPMAAVYHRRVLPVVERYLAEGQRKLVSFFREVRVRRIDEETIKAVDPELLSFVNINTPEDLEQALRICAGAAYREVAQDETFHTNAGTARK